MSGDATTEPHETTRIVVGFKDARSSADALRWAMERSRRTGEPLRVVHASAFPMTVRNGPSVTIARRLGDPSWATLHSIVSAFSPPEGTETIADEGAPARVLERWAAPGDVVVLGDARRRSLRRSVADRLRRRVAVEVVEIEPGSMSTAVPSTVHRSENAPASSQQEVLP